jgi:sulfite reductase (ferredoxin)
LTDLGVTTESGVEVIKRESRRLRGDLASELGNGAPNVGAESEQILKFHGIYSGDNRDVRRSRTLAGEGLEYIFMIRVVVPGGTLSSAQWRGLDEIAEKVADGTIRLTTRQAVQFHGVVKGDLRSLAQSLDRLYLSSFGACGDVVRNVVACPMLHTAEGLSDLASWSASLREAFRSTSQAHWEIFVNGDRFASREELDERPFYAETYLPRKFKIAISHPEENCVDVFAQDVGLIPYRHPEFGPGFTVLVGGGLGRAYANEDTFARLADPLCFATESEVRAVIGAILAAFHDLGDRADRRRARLKYVVADLGLDAFRREVESRLGRELAPAPAAPERFGVDDHLGWRDLPSGRYQVGVRVGAGRVSDTEDGARLRSALRVIAETFDVTFSITAQQDVVVGNIAANDRERVAEILRAHRVKGVDELGPVERSALACPALPTCSQALTEAERKLPEVVSALEGALARRSLAGRSLQLRVTGCPNGCARPALAEVGIVGRTKSTYDLYVGGGPRGDRLATLYREKVALSDVDEALAPLLNRWEREAGDEESFGDFVTRVGLA